MDMRGFTLIEVLLVITIFSIVTTAFFELFGSAFQYQREYLDKISLLNNAYYIMEYMSRSLRLAKKDRVGHCIGKNRNYAVSGKSITFLNFRGQCQRFRLSNQSVEVAKSQDEFPRFNNRSMVLSSSNIKVLDLKFYVVGEPQPPEDTLQPRVTMVLKLQRKEQKIFLQTTVTKRQLDVHY